MLNVLRPRNTGRIADFVFVFAFTLRLGDSLALSIQKHVLSKLKQPILHHRPEPPRIPCMLLSHAEESVRVCAVNRLPRQGRIILTQAKEVSQLLLSSCADRTKSVKRLCTFVDAIFHILN